MRKAVRKKHEGYAIQKVREIRDRAEEDVERLRELGRPEADIERAEARLWSWNEVIGTYDDAKWLAARMEQRRLGEDDEDLG